MPPRPRHPVLRTTARRPGGPAWAPGFPADTPPEASSLLTVSVRAAAEAAHDLLQDALCDLGRPAYDADAPVVSDRVPGRVPDRWVDEGGPLGRLYAGAHRLSPAERDSWEAREFARDRVGAAAGAYARALRREGVGLPAVLVAVRVTVERVVIRDGVPLPPAALAALQRDAAHCCLEAFYAH